MKRLVIAIDCDDVLVPATEACVRLYNEAYGTTVRLENAHEASNQEWQVDRGELVRRFFELWRSDAFTSIPPFNEAIQACKRLAENHELHMVTARQSEVIPVTLAMIDRYFPGVFTDVEHVGLEGSKGEICARLSADVLIDDNFKHLISAKDCGVGAQIWFGDYPWQTESPEPEAVTVRCYDWPSVEVEIAKLAFEQPL